MAQIHYTINNDKMTVNAVVELLNDKEMKLVRWPKKEEVIKYTIATLVFVIFFALFFAGLDLLSALVKGWFN